MHPPLPIGNASALRASRGVHNNTQFVGNIQSKSRQAPIENENCSMTQKECGRCVLSEHFRSRWCGYQGGIDMFTLPPVRL